MSTTTESPNGKQPGALKRTSKFAIWFALGGLIFGLLFGEQLGFGFAPGVIFTTVCCTSLGVTVVGVYFASRTWIATKGDDPNEDAFDDG